ncbi:MAG TPA: helix-turn-helix transcriptional regulator [Vicinamibacterales bacterium]|jgi:DNA-binding transcriptional ArsR family regulator
MNAAHPDESVAAIAAAIGEPARARMLYCLADGRARTATELAIVGAVTPSTASAHLQRLTARRLVTVVAQGKHRYYALNGPDVAAALEALNVVAGTSRGFHPTTPPELRAARSCYDHIAGALGVAVFDRFIAAGWLSRPVRDQDACDVTALGRSALTAAGLDVDAAGALRRRFAFACLDWSERRPHLGGALGAAVLDLALRKRWVVRDLNTRILNLTPGGTRELRSRLGVDISGSTGKHNVRP